MSAGATTLVETCISALVVHAGHVEVPPVGQVVLPQHLASRLLQELAQRGVLQDAWLRCGLGRLGG